MKLKRALGAFLVLLAASPAAAASYPGEEITVNPGALGNGFLLYPGGKYGRHVGKLLQPGDRGGPVRLHMPTKHVARHIKPHEPRVAAAPDGTITIPAETEAVPLPATPPPSHLARAAPPHRTAAAPAPHKIPIVPPPTQTAAATPPPAQTVTPGQLPDSAAGLFVGPATTSPPPQPVKPAKTPKPAPATTRPTTEIPFTFSASTAPLPGQRAASVAPPPANMTPPPAAGLRKQTVIAFAVGASSPASADVNAIHTLATTLNAALSAGAARVQLEAYGGPRGDKSSDSRRLSLKRALVVRELLIEDGVPSEKIDVRAMGGVDDNGAADRVDVFVRA